MKTKKTFIEESFAASRHPRNSGYIASGAVSEKKSGREAAW
jgi:hypothetical protein